MKQETKEKTLRVFENYLNYIDSNKCPETSEIVIVYIHYAQVVVSVLGDMVNYSSDLRYTATVEEMQEICDKLYEAKALIEKCEKRK